MIKLSKTMAKILPKFDTLAYGKKVRVVYVDHMGRKLRTLRAGQQIATVRVGSGVQTIESYRRKQLLYLKQKKAINAANKLAGGVMIKPPPFSSQAIRRMGKKEMKLITAPNLQKTIIFKASAVVDRQIEYLQKAQQNDSIPAADKGRTSKVMDEYYTKRGEQVKRTAMRIAEEVDE